MTSERSHSLRGPSSFHRFVNRRLGYMFLAPLIAVLLVVNLYPSLYQLWISFSSYRLAGPPARFVGWANYARLLHDERLGHSLIVTLKFLAYTVPMELVAGMALALLLSGSRWRKYFLPPLLIPVIITPVVAGYIFQYLYREEYGLIPYLLGLIGIDLGYNVTTHPATVIAALAIVDIWQWTPFACVVMLAGLQSLPHSVFEAARVDGAGPLAILRSVTLPLLKNQILIVLLFRTVDGLKVFDTVYAMTRGGPGTESEVVSLYLHLVGFQFRLLGYGAAIGMVLVLLGTLLANFYFKLLRAQVEGGEAR